MRNMKLEGNVNILHLKNRLDKTEATVEKILGQMECLNMRLEQTVQLLLRSHDYVVSTIESA